MFLPPGEQTPVAGESRPGVDKRAETTRLEQVVLNLLPPQTRDDSQIHIKEVQVRSNKLDNKLVVSCGIVNCR